jgi:hypothetical protein
MTRESTAGTKSHSLGEGVVRSAFRHLLLVPGIHLRRRILVLESDDWGSIRLPSREVYDALLRHGVRVDRFPFNRVDALASMEDLSALMEVLASVHDHTGHPAVMTLNTIVANPDFDRIRASDFREYYYEPFPETLQRYPSHDGSFALWHEGMEATLFKPQFHGREHLNVLRWLRALRENRGRVRMAFQYRMADLSESEHITEDAFADALNFSHPAEMDSQRQAILEGTQLFEQLFGYRSMSFIAPNYIWDSRLNGSLRQCGIRAFQGIWVQFEPLEGPENRFRRKLHYLGERNREGQLFLVRNAGFEPSLYPGMDCTDSALQRIAMAFRMGKPAIVGTHRLNFCGTIDPANRDRNLPAFRRLLHTVRKKWPDVEFMSSDQLAELILTKKSGNE